MAEWQQQQYQTGWDQSGWQSQGDASSQWQQTAPAQPQNVQAWNSQPSWGASQAGPANSQNAFTQPPSQNWAQPSYAPAQQQNSQQWAPSFQPQAYDLGNPMLNVGLQAGAHMMQEQAELAAKRYMPGVNSFWGNLKRYFYVNNRFVVKKLSVLMFPFIKKDWERSPTFEPPASDLNSPDLYIPCMALSTYVLTVGLAKGTSMTFDPEVIVDTFGTSVMIQLVQIGLLRVAQMVFVPWASALSWLELFAISGYQFVGVALNMLIGLLFGHVFYLVSLCWTATCTAFVMTQTMRSAVPPPEPGQRGKRRRVNFLIVAAVLQVLVMWFLGYSRELRSGGVFFSASSVGFREPSSVVDSRSQAVPVPPQIETPKFDEDFQTTEKESARDKFVEVDQPNKPIRGRDNRKPGKAAAPVDDSTDV